MSFIPSRFYEVVAYDENGRSITRQMIASSPRDALDRLIEYYARIDLCVEDLPSKGRNYKCRGIKGQHSRFVNVWTLDMLGADPISSTGCLYYNNIVELLPETKASLVRRKVI